MKTKNRSFLYPRTGIFVSVILLFVSALIPHSVVAADCAGVAVWNATSIYVAGNQVQYNGTKYQAKWWTQAQNPEQNLGSDHVWLNLGTCNSAGDGDRDGDGSALSNNVAVSVSAHGVLKPAILWM